MKLDPRETALVLGAITIAIEALSRLPENERPESDIADLRSIHARWHKAEVDVPGIGDDFALANRRLDLIRPTAAVLPFTPR